MKRPTTERFIVWGGSVGIAGACLVLAFAAYGSPVGRVLLVATAVAALLMRWTAARYATGVLITAAWLGRAVSAFWQIEGYDDQTNLVVALLWPCLWVVAVALIFAIHRTRVAERALGI